MYATLLPARRALAQQESTLGAGGDEVSARRDTMARALFEEGLRFVDAGKWALARDRFSRVLALRYSAVAAYNLALAQARLGHGVIAAAGLRKLLGDPDLDAKVRAVATALLADTEARFGWLTLRVAGPCRGCRAYVDREQWPAAVLGVSVPIDAGLHVLELKWDGLLVGHATVHVREKQRVEAQLIPRAEQLAAARAQRVRAAQQAQLRTQGRSGDAQETTSLLSRPLFWGAVGVLVVGAVTAVAIGTR